MRRPRTVLSQEPGQEPPKIPPIAIVLAVVAVLVVVGTLIASSGGGDDKKDDGGLLGRAPTPGAGVTSVPATTPTAILAGATTPTPVATAVPAVERILFNSDRDGKEDIYFMNSDGSGQTRLTS